jgi:hypothetical protein
MEVGSVENDVVDCTKIDQQMALCDQLEMQKARPRFRVQSHPSKQQPYKISEFSVLSVDKNGLWAAAHPKSVRVVRG